MVLQLSQTWRGRESPGGTRSTSLAPQFEQKFIGGKGMLAPMIHNGARDGRSAFPVSAPPVPGPVRADGFGSLPLSVPLFPFSDFLQRVVRLRHRTGGARHDGPGSVPARGSGPRDVPRPVCVHGRAGASGGPRPGGLPVAQRDGRSLFDLGRIDGVAGRMARRRAGRKHRCAFSAMVPRHPRALRAAALAFALFALVQVLNLYTDVFTGPEGRTASAGERLVRYLDSDNASGERIRIQLFLYAWLMFLSNPILGAGFGEYGWRAFELATYLPGPVTSGLHRHSHNLFLQLLAETGIAGFVCIAAPLVAWLYRMPWRHLSPARCWALGVLAIMGLHSMVEFPRWHANFLGIFALLLGTASPAFAALELNRLHRALFLTVVVAGGLAARSVWSDYRAFEAWFLKVEARAKRGGLSDSADFESLIALQGHSVLAPYFDRVLTEVMELDERNLKDKLAFNGQAMRIYPAPPMVHRQIVLLALAGRDSEAARMLRAAVRVYPGWTREWLPQLEVFARARPGRFAGLLASARAQFGQAEPERAFAPLPGKR